LPAVVGTMPHVSAVILFIERTVKDEETINKRTVFYGYINPSATKKIPKDIEAIFRAHYTPPYKSLLDD
jgi:hypothetical protein